MPQSQKQFFVLLLLFYECQSMLLNISYLLIENPFAASLPRVSLLTHRLCSIVCSRGVGTKTKFVMEDCNPKDSNERSESSHASPKPTRNYRRASFLAACQHCDPIFNTVDSSCLGAIRPSHEPERRDLLQ